MDGQLFTYTTKLDKCKLSFYLPDGTLTNYIQVDNKISLRDLQLRQIKLILGLNLFFTTFTGCVLTPSNITFLTYPSLALTSEYTPNCGGNPPSSTSTSPCCQNYIEKDNKPAIVDENYQDFQDSDLYLELVEIPQSQSIIIPEYLYNLLSSGNLEIIDILSELAKEKIIRENPGKHWEKIELFVN